ncbi:MAG: LysR family transcriptional regulator [Bacteroides sp.]|nr:LysR family transcriptional regulator [Bacteroides sp.]
MDIRVMRYFLAIAREESITRAAELLRISQPPLSRQMKELEEELGKQLFIRGTKKITLTDEGIILRKRAEEMLELLDKTTAEIKSSNNEIGGNICIGSGETDAFSLIANAAKELQKNYPNITYSIFSGDAAHITERLDRGLIDFGLLVEPVDLKKYDYVELPARDTWGVLMPEKCALAERNAVTSEDLWDKPLIISQQTERDSEIMKWIGHDFSTLKVAAKYDLIYNATHLVKAGFGYAIALDKLINISDGCGLAFRPLSPQLGAKLYLVWGRYQVFTKAAQKFIEQVKQNIEQR